MLDGVLSMPESELRELSWSSLMSKGIDAHRDGQEAVDVWIAEVCRRLHLRIAPGPLLDSHDPPDLDSSAV